MSAEDQGSTAAPATPAVAAPAAAGPVEITVFGQKPEDEVTDKPAEAAAAPAKAAGSEEQVAEPSNRDEKGRFKPGVQDRIDDLTRARREAEREAEYWKARAQSGAAPKADPAEGPQAPVKANFQTEEAYVEALVDFKAEQKLNQKLAERDAQQKQVKAQETVATSWQSKLAEARTQIEGFDAAMDAANAPVAAHVAELIMEHDHGAKVAHHLATNPGLVEKLNEMSPAKVAFEIGKLATKFDSAPSEAPAASSSKPAAEVQVSKAPPPAGRAVGAGRSTAPALAELGMDDYIAQRKQQGAGWAR